MGPLSRGYGTSHTSLPITVNNVVTYTMYLLWLLASILVWSLMSNFPCSFWTSIFPRPGSHESFGWLHLWVAQMPRHWELAIFMVTTTTDRPTNYLIPAHAHGLISGSDHMLPNSTFNEVVLEPMLARATFSTISWMCSSASMTTFTGHVLTFSIWTCTLSCCCARS